MDNNLVSLSILFVLISLLLAKHLKYHYFLILFLSLFLIYLIHFKLIIYLDNEKFSSCSIVVPNLYLDPNDLEKIMDKLKKFN